MSQFRQFRASGGRQVRKWAEAMCSEGQKPPLMESDAGDDDGGVRRPLIALAVVAVVAPLIILALDYAERKFLSSPALNADATLAVVAP